MNQHMYGSTDWHLPSPSSTPKSVTFPDGTLKTPKAEAFPQSHFIDAWATPRINGQHTPVQTPSFTFSTPTERPSSSYTLKPRTPEDPEFHVNHFVPNNLPLPPVEVSRRLSSSPDPSLVRRAGVGLSGSQVGRPRPVTMDFSQMQTPPPTRDANSRRSMQQGGGNEFATPATVIRRTPNQMPSAEALFNQTPFGFTDVQFSPSMMPFSNAGPMSAPPMPQSRLFWDQPNDESQMEVDIPLGVDPFGPTPHKVEQNFDWQAFSTPTTHQVNSQAFQGLHTVPSPAPVASFAASSMEDDVYSQASSFMPTSVSVDPNMLFSFSNPDVATSFGSMPQQCRNITNRQPYETQAREAQQEKEIAKKAKSQHSRTNTNSSSGSAENVKPGLQRSNIDSGLRKSRPSSMESRNSIPVAASTIPRRSSPLKRQNGGSLTSIPEIRRPRTRLIIDETGRARTETVPAEDEETPKITRQPFQQDARRQYPGLWDEDDSESEDEEPQPTISRNASFNIPQAQPQRRSSKHARTDSGGLERSNSFKIPRPASRPSSVAFDRAPFEPARPPVRRVVDNAHRRLSMMDLRTSFEGVQESEDQHMPDSPGDALGALKKVVAGRQQRAERASQNTLKAHNQRWAQASADFVNASTPHGHYDPFSNSFNASPSTDGLTTPSTDRSSLTSESTRCVCNGIDDGQPMVQCESCNKWLHMGCVGLHSNNIPPVYVCVFCTGQTPVARGGRVRGPLAFDSPLTHKSMYRR